jgi:hypothetical protein
VRLPADAEQFGEAFDDDRDTGFRFAASPSRSTAQTDAVSAEEPSPEQVSSSSNARWLAR